MLLLPYSAYKFEAAGGKPHQLTSIDRKYIPLAKCTVWCLITNGHVLYVCFFSAIFRSAHKMAIQFSAPLEYASQALV